jgi:hypothetical protein
MIRLHPHTFTQTELTIARPWIEKASFGFSGKYFCLGGHAGRKWEIQATVSEMTLLDTPLKLKLKDFILEVYKWKDPAIPANDGHFISFNGYVTLGGESDRFTGTGSLLASGAYQVGGAATNKTLYERIQLNVTGRLDIVDVSESRKLTVSGDLDIQVPCAADAVFAGTAVVAGGYSEQALNSTLNSFLLLRAYVLALALKVRVMFRSRSSACSQ